LAVVCSAPVIGGIVAHFLSGGGEESSAHLSSLSIAGCVLITAVIEAVPVFLLVQRDSRRSPNEI
jgi:hypothetical protein